MADRTKTCVGCDRELAAGEDVCPECGIEQPVAWMIYIVYGLVALFIIGVIYRLIWP